jgi:hypothetical protein
VEEDSTQVLHWQLPRQTRTTKKTPVRVVHLPDKIQQEAHEHVAEVLHYSLILGKDMLDIIHLDTKF